MCGRVAQSRRREYADRMQALNEWSETTRIPAPLFNIGPQAAIAGVRETDEGRVLSPYLWSLVVPGQRRTALCRRYPEGVTLEMPW